MTSFLVAAGGSGSFLTPNFVAGFSAVSSDFDSVAFRADQGRETVGEGVEDVSDVDVGASFIHEGFETVVIRPYGIVLLK